LRFAGQSLNLGVSSCYRRRAALGLCIKLSLCAGLIIAPLAEGATDSAKLEVLQHWKLGGEGGWDYLAADPAKERLFISRATRVDVISTASGKLIGSIPDPQGVHGVCAGQSLESRATPATAGRIR